MAFLSPVSANFPWKRAGIILVLTVLILAVFGYMLSFFVPLKQLFLKAGSSAVGASIQSDEHGFTNILLLGTGDSDHDGADLTDTILIASIDPLDTRSTVLVSLPRDLYIQQAGSRINALYATAKYAHIRKGLSEEEASSLALTSFMDDVSLLAGIPLHGAVKIDFTALQNLVDAVGGITINVPKAIVDYSYPVGGGRVGTFSIEAGEQYMDGKTALAYARSRHSTNDFDRSSRQQRIIEALAQKIRSMKLSDQFRFFVAAQTELEGHIDTTFSEKELFALGQIAADVPLSLLRSYQLNFYTGNSYTQAEAGGFVRTAPPEEYEGASVLLPASLSGRADDWGQIQTFIAVVTRLRHAYLEQASIQLAGPNQAVLWSIANELKRYGFSVEDALITIDSDAESTLVVEEGVEATAYVLSRMFNNAERSSGVVEGSGSVLLTVGSALKYRPLHILSGSVLSAYE